MHWQDLFFYCICLLSLDTFHYQLEFDHTWDYGRHVRVSFKSLPSVSWIRRRSCAVFAVAHRLLVSSEYSGQVLLSVFCIQFLNASLSFMRAVSHRDGMTWHECSPRSSEECDSNHGHSFGLEFVSIFLFFLFVFNTRKEPLWKTEGCDDEKWSWRVASAWMWKA